MISRINIFEIIRDHFRTLRSLNQESNKIYWKDCVLFLIFPSALAFLLTKFGYTMKAHLGDLITGISILGGFLFNLLAVIHSQIDKIKEELRQQEEVNESHLLNLKRRFVKEIHANISFCIVLSVTLILTLFLMQVDIVDFLNFPLLQNFLIFINYFELMMFTLTLLMIINRIYILLKRDTE